MDLPEEVKLRFLREKLIRGRIFWFRTSILDNPAITEREKFAVVVSCAIENDEVLFIYTTSQVDRANKYAGQAVYCQPGSYSCFSKETAIPVRNIKTMTIQAFAKLMPDHFKPLDQLSDVDMAAIDKIMMKNREIDVRIKVRCLPNAVR